MKKDKIIHYCKELGIDTIGFIKLREFSELKEFYTLRKAEDLQNEFEEADIQKRINPSVYMEEGKTIISIAFPYLYIQEKLDNGFSLYTKGLDYHKVVKAYLDKICLFINELGGEAIGFVDSNSLPERYIAYLAGVGTVGKNNMIITKKYGSYVFLGEIITDLEIYDADKGSFNNINKYEECGDCTKCFVGCPTKAISLYNRNCNICSSYITQKKDISSTEINLLKNKIFGCDICQLVCPLNSHISYSNIEDFKPLDYMNSKAEEVYAAMDNKFFKEKLSKTSCGWRGKNVIKRNAIIRLFKKGENIEKFKGDSPYINNYIDILNNKTD